MSKSRFRGLRALNSPELEAKVQALVADSEVEQNGELIAELITTGLVMGRDSLSVADLKLFNRALKEMRYAAKVFDRYREVRKVAVFGSARTAPEAPEFKAAHEFGRRMRENRFMIITGGGDGIMGAAQQGAGREGSFGLNIRLPFEQRPNPTIDGDRKLINFNYFFTRKLNFLKETHAVALFPGGFGTMDEAFETLTLMQTGKAIVVPLVLVDKPGGRYWQRWFNVFCKHLLEEDYISEEDFHLFKITQDVGEAVEEILGFYRNFHSYRWVGDKMVIRIQTPLSDSAVSTLSEEFGDLLQAGAIKQRNALKEESDDIALAGLKRIVLTPHRISFGPIRQLINAINQAETLE